jgi:phosphoglycerol geranylgeranyltransferase
MEVEKYIHEQLEEKKALLFSVLDPIDYPSLEDAIKTAKNMDEGGADAILIGGSTGVQGELLDTLTKRVKESVDAPVIFFPGNIGTVSKYGDALYFMSLLNSRNPYWISRAQMLAAPMVKQYGIEPLPVGYMVVEPGGTVGWVGEADMIPRSKPKLAAAMALGAQYMGFRFVITDAGSNPETGHIPLGMVKAVSSVLDVPYIVAGGIRTPSEAKSVIKAGADIIQVGTSFEKSGEADAVEKFVRAVREGKA